MVQPKHHCRDSGSAVRQKVGLHSCNFPSWTDIIDNEPCLTARENIYRDEHNENKRPMMLRPLQKSESLINPFWTSIINLVTFLPSFVVFYSTARTSILPQAHRRWIIRDKEPDWEAHTVFQSVEILALQVFNNESDITETAEIVEAAWLLTKEVERVKAKNKANYAPF